MQTESRTSQFSLRKPGFVFRMGDPVVTHGVPLDRFYFILLASSDVETKPNQIFFFPLWRLFCDLAPFLGE